MAHRVTLSLNFYEYFTRHVLRSYGILLVYLSVSVCVYVICELISILQLSASIFHIAEISLMQIDCKLVYLSCFMNYFYKISFLVVCLI